MGVLRKKISKDDARISYEKNRETQSYETKRYNKDEGLLNFDDFSENYQFDNLKK